jgi:transposase-like protein
MKASKVVKGSVVAEVARQLGVSTSAISKAVKREIKE